MFLRKGLELSTLQAVSLDYDKTRGQADGPSQASGKGDELSIDLNALLENDLLWAERGDGGDVTGEPFIITKFLITAACHRVPVYKKCHVDLTRNFAA